MPRIYLAQLFEVVAYLKARYGGQGYTSLREKYVWALGKAVGTTDTIPPPWMMTEEHTAILFGTEDLH